MTLQEGGGIDGVRRFDCGGRLSAVGAIGRFVTTFVAAGARLNLLFLVSAATVLCASLVA